MVALAKLSLAGGAAHQGLTPLVTALVLPFVLKFCFSFRPLHDTCSDMMHAMRLFVFQMGEIAFGREPTGAGDVRWQRAVRLVREGPPSEACTAVGLRGGKFGCSLDAFTLMQ
ncbi:UNVERIFIED_CONTAM: hypothetical protein Slati_1757700 [Sesamum latifolium]|uniref:Secreted protein n=1 Tax=Sesamum latifolium TaxID=2727402 RepID=A0AAW2WXX4_9LAMI